MTVGRRVALVAGALALALASLAVHRALAFDPEAWVVWGRELWTLSIDTSAGPSWKPAPLLVTAPAAALGDWAPWAWLVAARAGALLALAGAFELARRAAGPAAGVAAALLLAVSPWWLVNAGLGNAEPLLVALIAWAALAHQDGHPGAAFALGVAAALVRVEVWPFLALYAAWQARAGTLRWPVVLAAGADVLALWLVPDALSSGLDSLRGAADGASVGAAGNETFPFGAVLVDAGETAAWPVLAVAVLALGLQLRRRVRDASVWPALGGLAYVLLVAVMAQAGFAGNPRYLVPGVAALAIVAAVAAARVHAGLAAVLVVAALGWLPDAGVLGDRERETRAVERLEQRLRACRPVRGPADRRTLVARVAREAIPQAGAKSGGAVLERTGAAAFTLRGCSAR